MATSNSYAPKERDGSPWGFIQTARTLAPGIVIVTTASHGGIWLSPEREATIPAAVRAVARQYAPAPWYEEDCDVTIVALWFAPELEPIEPDFVRHCRTYANIDPRMRVLINALADQQPERLDVQPIIRDREARS